MSTGITAGLTEAGDLKATGTEEIALTPTQKRKLLLKLQEYRVLQEELRTLKHAIEKKTREIGDMRDDIGVTTLKVEGYKITLVGGVRRVFDPKLFVSNGGDLEIYNQSHVNKTSRSYNKISIPGGQNDEEEGLG